MSSLKGKKAPAFTLLDGKEKKVSLKNFKGKWVVLYFYPKDSTPGCTVEAIEFTAAEKKFAKLDCQILGVSPDSTKSHANFSAKQKLGITLLSDPEKKVLEKYGVWQLKKNYAKEYMGLVRSTFLINPAGEIVEVWENVKVKGHVEALLEKLKTLSKG